MKKKVISAALAGTLAVSLLSACGASNEPQNISDVSSAASSEATSTTASSESTGAVIGNKAFEAVDQNILCEGVVGHARIQAVGNVAQKDRKSVV